MGEIKNLIEQAGETMFQKQRKQAIKNHIDEIINAMLKQATSKSYHWVANDKTRNFNNEVYEFFEKEGFTIENFHTELRDENDKIIQERSFDIKWN